MSKNNNQYLTVLKPNQVRASVSSPIRIRTKTKVQLDKLILQANKNHQGRKIKADDLICYSLQFVEAEDIAKIQESSKTNGDRFEELYQQFRSKKKSLSKDQFLGSIVDKLSSDSHL